MEQETQPADVVPSIDEYVNTLCYGIWLVLQTANQGFAEHGPLFARSLADRVLYTPMPNDPVERCQYRIIREIARMLALKEKPE